MLFMIIYKRNIFVKSFLVSTFPWAVLDPKIFIGLILGQNCVIAKDAKIVPTAAAMLDVQYI